MGTFVWSQTAEYFYWILTGTVTFYILNSKISNQLYHYNKYRHTVRSRRSAKTEHNDKPWLWNAVHADLRSDPSQPPTTKLKHLTMPVGLIKGWDPRRTVCLNVTHLKCTSVQFPGIRTTSGFGLDGRGKGDSPQGSWLSRSCQNLLALYCGARHHEDVQVRPSFDSMIEILYY